MSRMDSILEDILYDAVDSYVSENREEIITDICRVASEEGKSLPSALEAVVVDWLSEGDGYFYIRDDMECQAEQSCDYEYDCEKKSSSSMDSQTLSRPQKRWVSGLSDTDESEVAAAVLKANLPSKKEVQAEVEAHVCSLDEYQKLVDEAGNKKGGDADR